VRKSVQNENGETSPGLKHGLTKSAG
jgi:hypothetical protein